jgi:hypothetical protein
MAQPEGCGYPPTKGKGKKKTKGEGKQLRNDGEKPGFPRIPSAKFTLSETNVLGTSKYGAGLVKPGWPALPERSAREASPRVPGKSGQGKLMQSIKAPDKSGKHKALH